GQFGQEYPGQFAQESTDHFRRIGMVNFEGFYRLIKFGRIFFITRLEFTEILKIVMQTQR
ncbi:hypothetical protein, partial [Chryseobacterium sp.]|uniref:hypothetical protein n=1 Tax=Chryseobacterium sp. TaxID=1871047 RepID=UPI0025BD1833